MREEKMIDEGGRKGEEEKENEKRERGREMTAKRLVNRR